MNDITITFIASMFALPAAAIIIIAVCIYHDIQSRKEMKHFKRAIRRCENVNGWDFTRRLLSRCSDFKLPVKNRIELLEHFAKTNTNQSNREV